MNKAWFWKVTDNVVFVPSGCVVLNDVLFEDILDICIML